MSRLLLLRPGFGLRRRRCVTGSWSLGPDYLMSEPVKQPWKSRRLYICNSIYLPKRYKSPFCPKQISSLAQLPAKPQLEPHLSQGRELRHSSPALSLTHLHNFVSSHLKLLSWQMSTKMSAACIFCKIIKGAQPPLLSPLSHNPSLTPAHR